MNMRIMNVLMAASLLAAIPARAAIVLIVNASNSASRMTAEQAAQFFLGTSNQLTPIDQSKDTPIRREFYEKVTHKSQAQMEGIWAKEVFSGKGTPPKSYGSDAAIKKAVAADPSAIAYIDKDSLDASVKALLTLP